MSRDPAEARQALAARLEWLRILGVSEIAVKRTSVRSGSPEAAGAVAAPARDAPPPPAPPRATDPPIASAPAGLPRLGLFGSDPQETPEEEPSQAVRTSAGRSGAVAASPLLSATAPEGMDAATALRAIREDLGDCRRCRLCERRTQVVFGVGDPFARLLFVGEGPGADEDAQGEPFVGRAGQLLTRMIEAMGLARGQVYIANVVKCRPPENRTPLPDEVATCSPFLFRQIAAIRPKVIVCLGTPSAQAVLGTRETITRLRGTFRDVGGYRVMPTFHPAYLLRNPAAKREVWDDLKQVMAALAES